MVHKNHKIPIRHHSLQKKNGVCHNHLWNNPKHLEKTLHHQGTCNNYLSILWGPDFPMVPTRWLIGGGPGFSKPQPLTAPLIAISSARESGHWKPTRDTAGTRGSTVNREPKKMTFEGFVRCGDGDDMWTTQVQDHLEVGLRIFGNDFDSTPGGFHAKWKNNNVDESVELSRIQKFSLVQIPLKRKNICNTVITVLTPFSQLANQPKSCRKLRKKHPKSWIILGKSQRRRSKKIHKKKVISDTLPKTNRSCRPQVPVSSKHMRLQNCL